MASVEIVWPNVDLCQECGSSGLVKLQNAHHQHFAVVWDGAAWRNINHGSLRCRDCATIHKLNYLSKQDKKLCFLSDPADEQVYLLTPHLGFTVGFAKLLWNQICRMHCSLRGAACAILLTSMPQSIPKSNRDDAYLAHRLRNLLFGYLCIYEGRSHFEIDDPIPEKDIEYDGKLVDTFEIFNAAIHDPGFKCKELDIVTDGNQQLHRKLEPAEKIGLKRLAGKPKDKAKKRKLKLGVTSNSRCATVKKHENIKIARTHTGGLFCSVNMKNRKGRGKRGGNEIVHLTEMLNSECIAYKVKSLKQVIAGAGPRKRIKVNKYCHDCACVTAAHMEKQYKVTCYLDGFHAKKHVCGFRRIQYRKRLNSSAAEQLWARMNKFSKGLTMFKRRYYRMWLRHYAVWRNAFIRGNSSSDTHPCVSRRTLRT